MRTRLMLGAALAAMLVGTSLVAAAGAPGSITLVSPNGGAIGGSIPVVWTSTLGGTVTADRTVTVEAKGAGPVWTTIASGVPILAGSAGWDTAGWADGTGYQVRLTVEGTSRLDHSDQAVTIDNAAPVLSVSLDPAACGAGWCNAAVATATALASDAASGLATPAVQEQSVSEEGVSTLRFAAADVVGNSAEVETTVRLDRTGPLTTIDPPPTPLARPLGDSIMGTASDPLSGVTATVVSFVDQAGTQTDLPTAPDTGGFWSVSTGSLLPGLYTVSAASSDAAGNTGDAASMQVLIL